MKNLIKCILICACLSCNLAMATNESSTLLMSESNGLYQLEFLNTDKVTALQFDVTFDGINNKNISTASCVSGLAKSHTGACKLTKDGSLRFLIYSNTNAVLDSGTIGQFKIQGAKPKNINVTKLLMGTPNAKEVKGSILLDIDNKKPLLEINKKIK